MLAQAACGTTGPKQAEERKELRGVQPEATRFLKRLTDHVGKLRSFSVRTQVTIEDELESRHIADFDVATHVTVERPNKLRASRRDGLVDRDVYYDGKSLTFASVTGNVYATVAAPATIPETLDYARETLDRVIPVSDLVYPNC